jgi:hypothetical protein
MVNRIETVAALGERNRATRHRSMMSFSVLSLSISYKYMLTMIIVFLISSLVATIAYSQELPADSAAPGDSGGWWSPETAQPEAAPQLLISMAGPNRSMPSNSLRISPALADIQEAEPAEASIASSPNLGLTDGGITGRSSTAARAPLPSTSYLALLQPNYAAWESSLADSRSQVGVNRQSVRPFMQIDYAGWQLPVTIYTPSLPDSNAR